LENFLGLQHIGLPAKDFNKTLEFYQSIGFKETMRTYVGEQDHPVLFLKKGNLVLEVYQSENAKHQTGAIDHIALDVNDIEKIHDEITQPGLDSFKGTIESLPFWENGVRYFTILGPNGEKVEFCQRL
jgi:catechol 2,3-dioxygenase-like lactoylglutathione lyase family enzyme